MMELFSLAFFFFFFFMPRLASPQVTGNGGGGVGGVSSVISRSLFEEMLMHRGDRYCPGGFYTYDAFLAAANAFPAFGCSGDLDTRRREVAAFFAQTSHETRGGWNGAPDGKYSWGYCWIEQLSPPSIYCNANYTRFPCAPGERYHGRGPIQLTWNFNYGRAGQCLGLDLLNDPNAVKQNATVAFMTALWFWMTPQTPKPSCHDVITGRWSPSAEDQKAGRLPGFGVVTNIVNRGECGHGRDGRVASRIGFYSRYCRMMGIAAGDRLDCYHQQPFGWEYVDEDPSSFCLQPLIQKS
ncbi:Chitinase 3 [Apostasia shenzhenica]|uniref:chitinase n=1 Tax=Apostasia shenzhenica TaxID=1088818 RepID=A0A2I0AX45_9ASPA|nr:Chitinase 3 [Apostasia shenzhenica]